MLLMRPPFLIEKFLPASTNNRQHVSACSLVVIEFKLQRFIVRDPEKSLGVFAGTWWDLTDEQREAAGVLGYQNDPDVVSSGRSC